MDHFTFADMKKIKRDHLGNTVPLELFRTIRLIGMFQGLPMNGKSTTATIGRKIGESMEAKSEAEIFTLFKELKIGIPSVVSRHEHGLRIAVDDCFCEGLPQLEGKMVCDLEGAIMEGALSQIHGKRVSVKEVKCNVHGDDRCEYEVHIH